MELRANGYDPRTIYRQNAELRGVMDLIGSGALSHSDPNLFRHLVDGLLSHDWFMLLADYQSYVECQSQKRALARAKIVGSQVDHQRCPNGEVLFGPLDSGIL